MIYSEEAKYDLLVSSWKHGETFPVSEEDGDGHNTSFDRFAVPTLQDLVGGKVCRQLNNNSKPLVAVTQHSKVVPPAINAPCRDSNKIFEQLCNLSMFQGLPLPCVFVCFRHIDFPFFSLVHRLRRPVFVDTRYFIFCWYQRNSNPILRIRWRDIVKFSQTWLT